MIHFSTTLTSVILNFLVGKEMVFSCLTPAWQSNLNENSVVIQAKIVVYRVGLHRISPYLRVV